MNHIDAIIYTAVLFSYCVILFYGGTRWWSFYKTYKGQEKYKQLYKRHANRQLTEISVDTLFCLSFILIYEGIKYLIGV